MRTRGLFVSVVHVSVYSTEASQSENISLTTCSKWLYNTRLHICMYIYTHTHICVCVYVCVSRTLGSFVSVFHRIQTVTTSSTWYEERLYKTKDVERKAVFFSLCFLLCFLFVMFFEVSATTSASCWLAARRSTEANERKKENQEGLGS